MSGRFGPEEEILFADRNSVWEVTDSAAFDEARDSKGRHTDTLPSESIDFHALHRTIQPGPGGPTVQKAPSREAQERYWEDETSQGQSGGHP